MRVLILGATGPVGLRLIQKLLKEHQSYSVVLYVRSPGKIPEDIKSSPSVTIIEGQLTDLEAVSKAMDDVDVVVSALGPSVQRGPFHPSNTPLANAFLSVIEIMHQKGVKRLICLGTTAIKDPADKFNLAFSVLIKGVATLAHNAYKDVAAIGDNVRTKGADLDWTIVRVPVLTDKETEDVIVGYVGDGKTNTFLSRAGFAQFVANEIQKKEWVQKAPLVCSA